MVYHQHYAIFYTETEQVCRWELSEEPAVPGWCCEHRTKHEEGVGKGGWGDTIYIVPFSFAAGLSDDVRPEVSEAHYSTHPWNINNLPRHRGSTLRYLAGDELITGVQVRASIAHQRGQVGLERMDQSIPVDP